MDNLNPNHITANATASAPRRAFSAFETPDGKALRECVLLEVMQDIVAETMDYPLQQPISTESFLPEYLVKRAQRVLDLYGLRVLDNTSTQEAAA